MYGLQTRYKDTTGLARKRIGFMTNSVCIAQQLERRCPNKEGYIVHRHIRLESGRTKAAQVYPKELCRAICQGLQNQIQADARGQLMLMEVGDERTTSKDLMNVAKELIRRYQTVAEPAGTTLDMVWGDVSGAELDPRRVRQAFADVAGYVHNMKFTKRSA